MSARGRAVLAAAVGVLALWAVALAGSASAATPCGASGVFSQSGATATCTYAYTGSEDTFTVPAGVGSVGVTAVGAPGGSATCGFGSCGGAGAVVTATVPLPVGTNTLYVEVGGTGQVGESAFNGGGLSPGGGGGGASDVRTVSINDPASLSSRLVVGGGGGGGPSTSGCVSLGGAAGDTSVTGPGDGGASDGCSDGGNGGFGGTAGGNGGTGDVVFGVDCTGGSGSLGQGGDFLAPPCEKGGGGGGGYYGGGAGGGGLAGAGGGGAGSSFWASGATGTSLSENTSNTAPASVTITYTVPQAALAISKSAPASVVSGRRLTYTVTATNTGGQTATGVTVSDPLPASAHFNAVSTTQGTCTRPASPKGGTVTCSVGSLGAGNSATIKIVVTATTPGTLKNTATVKANNVTPDGDDSATATTTVTGT